MREEQVENNPQGNASGAKQSEHHSHVPQSITYLFCADESCNLTCMFRKIPLFILWKLEKWALTTVSVER